MSLSPRGVRWAGGSCGAPLRHPGVLPSCSGEGCRADGPKHLPAPGTHPRISTPFSPGLQTPPSANAPPTRCPGKGDFSTIPATALLCLANGCHLSVRAPRSPRRSPALQDPQSSSPVPPPARVPSTARAPAGPAARPRPGYKPVIKVTNTAGAGDSAATREAARDRAVRTKAQAPGAAGVNDTATNETRPTWSFLLHLHLHQHESTGVHQATECPWVPDASTPGARRADLPPWPSRSRGTADPPAAPLPQSPTYLTPVL